MFIDGITSPVTLHNTILKNGNGKKPKVENEDLGTTKRTNGSMIGERDWLLTTKRKSVPNLKNRIREANSNEKIYKTSSSYFFVVVAFLCACSQSAEVKNPNRFSRMIEIAFVYAEQLPLEFFEAKIYFQLTEDEKLFYQELIPDNDQFGVLRKRLELEKYLVVELIPDIYDKKTGKPTKLGGHCWIFVGLESQKVLGAYREV